MTDEKDMKQSWYKKLRSMAAETLIGPLQQKRAMEKHKIVLSMLILKAESFLQSTNHESTLKHGGTWLCMYYAILTKLNVGKHEVR